MTHTARLMGAHESEAAKLKLALHSLLRRVEDVLRSPLGDPKTGPATLALLEEMGTAEALLGRRQ